MKKGLLIFSSILFVTSCSVDPELKPILSESDVKEIIPPGWPTPHYNYSNNPLTVDGFTLGRTLFYDPIFSADNSISCGSCHQQFAAFAHSGHDISHGVNGLLGTRNAPALQNLNWNTSFMHDGGVLNIELMPMAPITNPVEMDENMTNVVSKLSASGKYKQLFAAAYGDNQINSQRIFKAIAQFMGTMYSYNSKYDKVKSGKDNFTAQEQNGYDLFVQKCASCHTEPLFTDHQFRNNGLPVNVMYNDSGRAHITGNAADRYKFKTPSLRNIEKSGPYMHDGRFTTLDQCLEHYNSGIVSGPTLETQLQSGIPLSAQDKDNIIAFLKNLTDTKFLTDQRFSDNH
ncbi:MAG: cytochrome c peroxidase [Bacteroidota bacterium]